MASTTVPMGHCCLSGSLHSGKPAGREDTIGGIPCYVAEPSDNSPAKTVIFLGDIFGWKLPNIRLLADNYAKAGFMVYIPDIHEGDSLDPEFLQTVEPPLKIREQLTLVEKAKNTASVATTFGPWLIRHREGVTEPIVSGFINAVRMLPGTNKIGVIGFCWGGRYAILQTHASKSKSALTAAPTSIAGSASTENPVIGGVDAAVACHPSLVTVPGDFEDIAKPIAILCGEKDSQLDLNTVEKIKGVLEKKIDVPTHVKIFEDQVHGFTLRGDWGSEKDKKAMDEAEKDGIAWFNKYLS